MQVQTSEQTFFNFSIFVENKFPTKFFYNINYRTGKEVFGMDNTLYNAVVCGVRNGVCYLSKISSSLQKEEHQSFLSDITFIHLVLSCGKFEK